MARVAPERCGACDGPLRQDEDVLDTWFSSALWPFATLGWPEQTAALRAFYPTDVLVTARDIIFLWVARMIMMGLEFTGEVPFADVYVHAVIQAPDGRRMSKSLGTGIDPLEEIDRHGADAVRFGLLAMSSTQDVRYNVEKIEQGERLANKLFNAARFVLLGDRRAGSPAGAAADDRRGPLDPLAPGALRARDRRADRRLRLLPRGARRSMTSSMASSATGTSSWSRAGSGSRSCAPRCASCCARRCRSPIRSCRSSPRSCGSTCASRTRGCWRASCGRPSDGSAVDDDAEAALERVIAATQAVRSWRNEVGVLPGVTVAARLEADGYAELAPLLSRIARLDLRAGSDASVASVAIPGGVLAILEGVDLAAQEERRARERARLVAEIERLRGKLANDAFVANAPAAVVAAEREKLARLEAELDAL